MKKFEGINNTPEQEKKELSFEEIENIIKYRDNQTRVGRLCEIITGLKIEDSKLTDRLIEDQQIIRQKYGLPNRDIVFDNPSEYEARLHAMAKDMGLKILEKGNKNLNDFFDKNGAKGVFMPEEFGVGILEKEGSLREYQDSMQTLEHEIIHALQKTHFPGMPVEAREYEAHLAAMNPEAIIKYGPENVFRFFVGGSVFIDYKIMNDELKDKNQKIDIEWNSPEYFLTNIDGLSKEQIEAYRQLQKDLEKKTKD
jgi:hypothetical protein